MFLRIFTLIPAFVTALAGPVFNTKNWGLQNNITDSHVHAVDAWSVQEGSKDVVVAVVDTGVDTTHIDLVGSIWKDPKTGISGWDFTTNTSNMADTHGHGTNVAGIIGARVNAKSGTSGVAHRVSIMSIKYYSEKASGAENLRNSVRALNWAVDHGAHIINYSGGGPEFSMDEYLALKKAEKKGILVVAAAGNDGQNIGESENSYYPCAYELTNIVCVGATTIMGNLLSGSNYGKNVHIYAPGENILSTAPGDKYSYMSGTSQATAFVSGISALILSDNKCLK